MNNTVENDCFFGISQGEVVQMRWANAQAADVKFSQYSTHQKQLKSVNF